MGTLDVYGIGNAIMDLQLRIADADFERLGIPKGRMVLVDSDEQRALIECFHGLAVNQASGGSAANTMIALAQLGRTVGYGCIVGDDTFGMNYLDEMKKLGVSLHNPPIPHAVTGSSVILITPDAERTMNTSLGITATFGPDHVNELALTNAQWLYIEGYLFASESGQKAVERAIAIAKKHHVKIAITFSDTFIVDVFRSAVEQAVEAADLIFANLTEGAAFTGETAEDDIFRKLKQKTKNFALTLGERGARTWVNGEEVSAPGYPVHAVDETGAGDMFAGGFLYGLTGKLTLLESTKLACFLASKVVSKLGPRLEDCDISKFETLSEFLPA